MILPVKYITDWTRLQNMRQSQMAHDNKRENKNRIHHVYSEGDKVLLKKPGIIPKMDAPRTGPHLVTKVWSNGTVTIQCGAITE